MAVKPTDQKVICQRQEPGGANGVVGADVSHDGQFAWQWHVGAHEHSEERGERTFSEPVAKGVEDQFAAAIGVFLPSGELVVDG